jgi:hypothetical protein
LVVKVDKGAPSPDMLKVGGTTAADRIVDSGRVEKSGFFMAYGFAVNIERFPTPRSSEYW